MIVYVDGACSGNPGPGGWGVVIKHNPALLREMSGGAPSTTNNRMELMAAIMALEGEAPDAQITIFTDSRYVCNGMTEWRKGWERRGWRTANGKPVLNKDLWLRLIEAAAGKHVDWRWVKGHSGNPGNERADALANQGLQAVLGASRT